MDTTGKKLLSALLTLSLCMSGCGGDEDALPDDNKGGDSDAGAVAEDVGAGTDSSGNAPVVVNTIPLNIPVTVSGQQFTLTARLLRPVDCQAASPCQLVVVVGDRQTSPVPDWLDAGTRLAQATGAVVLVFNQPGTGSGGMKSGGVDDFGGEFHVQATKEAIRLTCSASKDYIDNKRCGYLSIGFGLIPAARALALHGMNSLKFVQYLVDVEGPTDRCAISEAPEDLAAGIGPDDGPGVSDSACNFGKDAPHSKVYPPAKEGKPKSIVCSESAWPITKTAKSCTDIWWQNREPSRSLKTISQRYWRLQFKYDHRLPSYESSRVAMRSMVSSKSKFFALNLVAQCSNAPSDADCEGKDCWLHGDWGTHFAPGPYAGEGKLISVEDLLGKAVPKFVIWVADVTKVPNCK